MFVATKMILVAAAASDRYSQVSGDQQTVSALRGGFDDMKSVWLWINLSALTASFTLP